MEDKKNQTVPSILIKLADLLGTEVKERRLEIPKQFGKGYCIGFVFNDHIRMQIMNYVLNEEILIHNSDISDNRKLILFKFQNIVNHAEILSFDTQLKEFPSVLIATNSINTNENILIHTNRATINIEVDANYLDNLLNLSTTFPVQQSLLRNTQPLLFEQIISPSLQKIIDEIMTEPVDAMFELFLMKIKAEELICKLLMEIKKCNETHFYSLNIQDIRAIHRVKELIITHLDIPPNISSLAVKANMSVSKLKRLFKQILGNTIFHYYQELRMKEAARLLKEEKISVSEVGYKLGFTNLSHFARIFKEHIGMNPKEYTKS
jgi:AraC-like DNA-binding protein